ncbi:Hypothetical_protein [Hexamita inflata]|uniref:Hypothetical_protein n=1 Tax=Hexamita inflata TaxID=28002 RepID=A0AA86Q6M1_9EUKA|nr:Hypothetical protein HINF_LOCUS34494 [Hexamita inflata]
MLKLLQKVIDSNPRDQTVKQTLLIIAQRYEVIQQTLSEHQSEFVFQRLIKLNDETTKYLTFIGVDVEGQLMKHFLTDAEMKARQAQMLQNTQSLQNAMAMPTRSSKFRFNRKFNNSNKYQLLNQFRNNNYKNKKFHLLQFHHISHNSNQNLLSALQSLM